MANTSQHYLSSLTLREQQYIAGLPYFNLLPDTSKSSVLLPREEEQWVAHVAEYCLGGQGGGGERKPQKKDGLLVWPLLIPKFN